MRASALGLSFWAVFLLACGGDDTTPPVDAAVDAIADAMARECTGNADCDDGLFCNGTETCVDNACTSGVAPTIDDGVDCTVDTCDEDKGLVSHTPDDAACDDGLYCNGIESCDRATGCMSNDAPVLDDGVDCSVDTCDEDADAILHTPDDGACDDGAFCNGAELCDTTVGCMAGVAPDPDDGIACTTDTCNEATDALVNTPNDGACDDGDACTDDTCTAGVGCSRPFICACMNAADCNDGNPCTNDACAAGSCAYTNNTASCDDGLYCNGADVCSGGACTHAGDPCSGGPMCARTCTEATDSCFAPSGTACTDDGNPCTNDVCNATGACSHPANTAPCSDGLYCNGADVCSGGTCTRAGDPCAGGAECADTCDEALDSCELPAGATCSDDGEVCTDDRCDGAGACTHPTNTAGCDDLDACTLMDRCGSGVCAGTPMSCSAPPADACLDTVTLRRWDAAGMCMDGDCNYAFTDVTCAFGCAAGACSGDPCAGITCTTPPADVCLDADRLRSYGPTGSCSDGACSYPPIDSVCQFGCAAGACAPDPCPSALQAHYELEQLSGPVVDSSGCYHGMAGGGVVRGASGVFGNGFDFAATDAHVVAPEAEAILWGDDFTIEAWVYRPAGGAGAIVAVGDATPPDGLVVSVTALGRLAIQRTHGPTCVTTYSEHSTRTVPEGAWTHVAIGRLLSGSLGYTYFFIDGEYVQTSAGAATTLCRYLTDELTIGSQGRGLAQPWPGLIDDVRIWNTSRSRAQVCGDAGGVYDSSGSTCDLSAVRP